jgi:Transposase, Mutator family
VLRFQREEHRDDRRGQDELQELLGKVLADEHADVLRQAVVWLAQELMEAEVSQAAGASYGERNPERAARRNGYRERAWDTRVGSIKLAIPRLRSRWYFPSFLEPRRRSEQALVAVVQEAYVNGVSTRKVERLVEALGLAGVSKDQVSRLCGGLDEMTSASSALVRDMPLPSRREVNGSVVLCSLGRSSTTGSAVVLTVSSVWPLRSPARSRSPRTSRSRPRNSVTSASRAAWMTSRTRSRATCSRTSPRSCSEANSASIWARMRSTADSIGARAWTSSALSG